MSHLIPSSSRSLKNSPWSSWEPAILLFNYFIAMHTSARYVLLCFIYIFSMLTFPWWYCQYPWVWSRFTCLFFDFSVAITAINFFPWRYQLINIIVIITSVWSGSCFFLYLLVYCISHCHLYCYSIVFLPPLWVCYLSSNSSFCVFALWLDNFYLSPVTV